MFVCLFASVPVIMQMSALHAISFKVETQMFALENNSVTLMTCFLTVLILGTVAASIAFLATVMPGPIMQVGGFAQASFTSSEGIIIYILYIIYIYIYIYICMYV